MGLQKVKKVKRVNTSAKRVKKVKTSAKRVKKVKTSANRVKKVKTSAKRVKKVKTLAKRVKKVKTLAKRVKKVKTSAKRVKKVKTSAKRVKKVKTSAKRVKKVKTSAKKVGKILSVGNDRLRPKSVSELDDIFTSTIRLFENLESPDGGKIPITYEKYPKLRTPERLFPSASSVDTLRVGKDGGLRPANNPHINSVKDRDIIRRTPVYGVINAKLSREIIPIFLLENGLWSILQPGIRSCTLGTTIDIMLDNHKIIMSTFCKLRSLGNDDMIISDLIRVFSRDEVIVKSYNVTKDTEIRQLVADLQTRSLIISTDGTGIGNHSIILDHVDLGKNIAIIRDPFHGWQVTISFNIILSSVIQYVSKELETISVMRRV
jgi:hypothetical protein